ncbi:hypothetical protein ACJX0J_032167 [Zea mays]
MMRVDVRRTGDQQFHNLVGFFILIIIFQEFFQNLFKSQCDSLLSSGENGPFGPYEVSGSWDFSLCFLDEGSFPIATFGSPDISSGTKHTLNVFNEQIASQTRITDPGIDSRFVLWMFWDLSPLLVCFVFKNHLTHIQNEGTRIETLMAN